MAPSQFQLKRAPRVELRVLRPDYCEFVLRDTDVSVANVLRRVIISHVPTIAVSPTHPFCNILSPYLGSYSPGH